MAAEVVVELSGKEILRVPLKGPSMLIGRDPACDVHLDNRALSRKHAQIEKRGAAIWIRDLESQNGTFVNGERVVDPQALNGGDIIEVGRYQVRVDGTEQAAVNTPVLTLSGPEGRHRFAMVGDEIIIGRAPSCDIAIGHKSISRRHVRIAIDGDRFVAEDLGSQNGTRLNNKRINGPTAFKAGDKVQMSDFTIEVGFLEAQPQTNGEKASKTMMLDRSELAKAAYVGGDFGKGDNAANISLGHAGADEKDSKKNDDESDDGADDSATHNARPEEPAQKKPAPPRDNKVDKRPPEPDRKKPKTEAKPRVIVSHPELDDRTVVLSDDVTVVGEDGEPEDSTDGRSFANQGYVLFQRSAHGVVVTVAGDRQLVVVNGKPHLFLKLTEGDTVEFGLLSFVFHEA